MYRDDHEAALARVQALETELAAHANDDHKISALTREITDARARLDRAETELRRMRSTATPSAAARSPLATPTTEPSTRSPILALVVLFGGLGAMYTLATVNCHHETVDAPSRVEVSPLPAVSGDEVLADGVARATELAPGAQLVRIETTGVRADGNLDPQYGVLTVELVRDHGPEPIAPVDPSRPIGAPEPEHDIYLQYDCIQFVYTHGRWQDQYPAITMDVERLHSCIHTFENHPPLRRRCSLAQIWQRARHDAPATAIAKLTLDATGWTFTIDDPRLHVERHERDDCGS